MRWALLLLLIGCVPEARDGARTVGGPSRPDAMTSSPEDAAATPEDASSDPDGGAEEDAGTPPEDAGVPPEDAGAPAPDAGVPAGCPAGFIEAPAGCLPDAPSPFRERTEADVCARWNQDHADVSPEWTAADPNDACDAGTISEAAYANAITRTNLYRWLVDLAPVTEDTGRRQNQQACAVLMKSLGYLSHNPPADDPCHTPEGAAGAGSSNIAFGSSMAGSVDLYIGDDNVPSLGHRRWVTNPRMEVTAFGVKPSYSCMYSFSSSGPVDVDFVAWPPPGYVPAASARGRWSFNSPILTPTARVLMSIDGGPFTEVTVDRPGGGFGWSEIIAWDPPQPNNQIWRAGVVIQVRIEATDQGTFAYTVAFVGC